MLDDAMMVSKVLEIADAMSQMDFETLSSLLAEDITYVLNGTLIATTRTDLIQALSALRTAGLTGQYLVSVSARMNVAMGHGYNTYADGHIVEGGQMALFNDDGKVVVLCAMTTAPTVVRPVDT